jgi:hypothetical protein
MIEDVEPTLSVDEAIKQWNDIKSDYPSWGEYIPFSFGRFKLCRAVLGDIASNKSNKWEAFIEVYDSHLIGIIKRSKRYGSLDPDRSWGFGSFICVKDALDAIDEWLEVRRNPSTWENGVSDDDRQVLEKGTVLK